MDTLNVLYERSDGDIVSNKITDSGISGLEQIYSVQLSLDSRNDSLFPGQGNAEGVPSYPVIQLTGTLKVGPERSFMVIVYPSGIIVGAVH